jgi:hypothetical protein
VPPPEQPEGSEKQSLQKQLKKNPGAVFKSFYKSASTAVSQMADSSLVPPPPPTQPTDCVTTLLSSILPTSSSLPSEASLDEAPLSTLGATAVIELGNTGIGTDRHVQILNLVSLLGKGDINKDVIFKLFTTDGRGVRRRVIIGGDDLDVGKAKRALAWWRELVEEKERAEKDDWDFGFGEDEEEEEEEEEGVGGARLEPEDDGLEPPIRHPPRQQSTPRRQSTNPRHQNPRRHPKPRRPPPQPESEYEDEIQTDSPDDIFDF